MENMFTPRSLNIKQIFGDADAFYKIPRYQRPYRWVNEQVDKLWDDLYESYKEEIENYFLGSIILAFDSEKSSYRDVVDGQQRLTTLTILLCVIRDLFPNLNKTDGLPDPNNIDIHTIKNSIFYNENIDRLKLFTHSQHQNDFEQLIIKGNTTNLQKPFKYQVYSDEEPKYKYINTAILFREKLEKIGEVEAGKFINYVFNNVFIIRIDCSSTEFAIRMFQVLNDRGMDLTNADLIKSFLFESIKNISDDEEIKKQNEDTFISEWQSIEYLINDIDVSLNDMLVVYEYYLLAANPKKSLYDELENVFTGKNPLTIISEFKKFVKSYKEVLFDGQNKIIYSFWYLRWAMYWKAILGGALQENYPDFEELSIALRRFYYLYWIAGRTLTKVKQTSFNIIKWIKENKIIEFIKSEMDNKLSEDKIIPDVLESLSSKNVYNSPWLKPLLLMIEYNQTDSVIPFVEMDRNLHIEHILPIEWKKYDEWKEYITDEISDNYINSIGNLTLLSGKKNIEASNNPFSIKIGIYEGKGKYGNNDNKITSFSITQKIRNDYNSNKYEQKWNEKAIIDRWNWFLDETQKILNIDLSKIKKLPLTTAISNAGESDN